MKRLKLSPRVERLLSMEPSERRRVIKQLTRIERSQLYYHWDFWGRPEQVWRPGPWTFDVFLAGRGWGKTRVGAEAARYVAENPDLCGGQMGIAGRTANDVNLTMIREGIMRYSPPWFRPRHWKNDRLLEWPNGVTARLMSGDVPDSFRGPNFGWLWCEEYAHWKRAVESWETAQFALRHGDHPRALFTTTPIGNKAIVDLCFELDEAGAPIPAPGGLGYKVRKGVRIIRGSTYDNAANLAADFFTTIVAKHEGTRLAAQELEGAILLGIPAAIYRMEWMLRADEDDLPEFVKVVVAIDPAVSEGDESSETGIVVVALGEDDRIYLLRDLSGHYSATAWAKVALGAWKKYDADLIVGEINQGGNLIEQNIRLVTSNRRVKFESLNAGKTWHERWSLVSGLWEQGKVSHVGPARHWVPLEHQFTHGDPTKPKKGQMLDRGDAATWGAIALLGGRSDRRKLRALGKADAWAKIRKELEKRSRGKSRHEFPNAED